ncbi:MAG: hypothetical protein JXB49_31230 [Bacteroidales bacterium]|nr:hypothetical protein [Bacteroidales bacterium]
MKKILFIAIALYGLSIINAKAQDDAANFLSMGLSESEKLIEAYLDPMGKAIGAGLGTGWYTSAKPHKLGGFDLTFSLNLVNIPSSDKMFNVESIGIDGLTSDVPETPTAVGDKDVTPANLTLVKEVPGVGSSDPLNFSAPGGLGIKKVPVPMVNVAVGLPKGTEIIGRFIPTIKIPDIGKMGLWGVGLKHDVLQWLPAVDKIPFDLSVLGGFTKFNASYDDISITPDVVAEHNLITDNYVFDDQVLSFSVSSITTNIIISKKLAVFTPYLGVGFTRSKFNITLDGDYPVPRVDVNPTSPYVGETIVTNDDVLNKPIDIDIKNFMGNATLGMRLKFSVFAFHGQYTFQKYPTINFGFGINFR